VDWPLAGHQIKAWILTTAAAVGVGVPAVFCQRQPNTDQLSATEN
jgi:hypothetical protein